MQENQEKFIEKVKEKNKSKNLKYSILTMGCQLNENDSEKISGMLTKMGYNEIEDYKRADLIIFNTLYLFQINHCVTIYIIISR